MLIVVARTFGDVYEYDLETRRYIPLTHHYYHGGYTRALYLSNGDILLSGPEDFPGDDWRQARFFLSELWVLSRALDRPPTKLGTVCWEGPAVSRTQLRIAWSQFIGPTHGPGNPYRLQVADIDYSSGQPKLLNPRVVLTNDRDPIKNRLLEPQNFRPGREQELIFSAARNFDVYGLIYDTGELVNYSQSPDTYDEAEGAFPDGEHILVESSRGGSVHTSRHIDLWKLRLDPANPSWERLTWFTVGGNYKASNPVVSDDGRFIAFQVPRGGDMAGIGHGIYVLDLEARARALANH